MRDRSPPCRRLYIRDGPPCERPSRRERAPGAPARPKKVTSTESNMAVVSSYLANSQLAGVGTWPRSTWSMSPSALVAGLQRADPSTTLDKSRNHRYSIAANYMVSIFLPHNVIQSSRSLKSPQHAAGLVTEDSSQTCQTPVLRLALTQRIKSMIAVLTCIHDYFLQGQRNGRRVQRSRHARRSECMSS